MVCEVIVPHCSWDELSFEENEEFLYSDSPFFLIFDSIFFQ